MMCGPADPHALGSDEGVPRAFPDPRRPLTASLSAAAALALGAGLTAALPASAENGAAPPPEVGGVYGASSDPIGPGDVRIHDIQGSTRQSPLVGELVDGVPGVVTAVAEFGSARGFWFQDTEGDGNPRTSEGLFVFTGEDTPRSGSATRSSRPAA